MIFYNQACFLFTQQLLLKFVLLHLQSADRKTIAVKYDVNKRGEPRQND